MSGHSKWSQIKRQKEVTDKKRGNLFTKLAKAITLAAKQGGGDPAANFKLRLAVDKAKAANMPNENINRAIERGSGSGESDGLEEIIYEGYGPGGVAIIIEAATDNKNRTSNSLKSIFSKNGGKLGSTGNVAWLFEKKGVVRITHQKSEKIPEFELNAIEAGADDINDEEEGFTIFTDPAKLSAVKDWLSKNSLEPETAALEMVPTNHQSLTEKEQKRLDALLMELDENEDIHTYYTNAANEN